VLAEVSTRSGSSLHYYLDSSLEVADLRVSDTFVYNHDRLLDHRFSQEEELDRWKTVLRYERAPDANKLHPP